MGENGMKKVTEKRLRKQRELVKWLIGVLLIVFVVSMVFMISFRVCDKGKEERNLLNENQVISNILGYHLDERIDKKFLEWFVDKYSMESLGKLEEVLRKGEYRANIWHDLTNCSFVVLFDQYRDIRGNRIREIVKKQDTDTVISFVGDVSLADNWYIMTKYDERKKKIYGILSEDVVSMMREADIMIANNEFTVSNRGEKMSNKHYTFRASPDRLRIYEEMGVDLVTLANNHVYDFGKDAFIDTLNSLKEYQIPYVGAGRDLEEAKQAYYFIVNGYKFGFVNATRAEKFILTPEATITSGGVLRCYDPSEFIRVIREAKENSDFVIALVHWGREDSSELESVQMDTAKLYIDAGADVIVGSHAHTLQGFDFYKGKAIVYNLGDFIFNHETKDTGIFQLKVDNSGNFRYFFQPCKEQGEYTYLLVGEERTRVLNKMRELSWNVEIFDDGEFYLK